MTSTLSAAYERLVLAHPARVLVVMLAVLGFFAWQARHFELDASADALLLEADRDLQTLAGATGALRGQGPARRHLRTGRRRLRGIIPRPAARATRPATRGSGRGIDREPSRRPAARQRRGRRAHRHRRQHPHPRRPRSRPRPRQAGTAREPGVQRGGGQSRCTNRRDPALHARRRGVPRLARDAEPPADATHRGRRSRRSRPRRARTHRGNPRNGETPRRREPACRDRGDPRRARGVRRCRRPAPRRRADDRRRHDHLHPQRPRRVRDRGGGVPRDRARRDLPRGALGPVAARGLRLRRPADDRGARAHGMESHGDLVELPGPDAHHHHLDEHPPDGTLPPAPP